MLFVPCFLADFFQVTLDSVWTLSLLSRLSQKASREELILVSLVMSPPLPMLHCFFASSLGRYAPAMPRYASPFGICVLYC